MPHDPLQPPSTRTASGSFAGALANRLVHDGHLSRAQADAAQYHAARSNLALAEAIVVLGQLPEAIVYGVLASVAGMTVADLSVTAATDHALRLLPERVARRHTVLPLFEDNRHLTYATAQPHDDEAERDVAFASGRRPRPVLAPRSHIVAAIDRSYGRSGEIEQLLTRIKSESRVQTADGPASVADSPAVRLCDQILAKAVNARASDIHIEPSPSGATVRYRVHGILETVLQLPREAVQSVTNRFKVISKVDIGVRQRPQDGAFRAAVDGRPVDVRLSTLPTVYGESVVMRIIDTASEVLTLDLLGHDPVTLSHLKRILARPDGLVLVTGPTGSGKTTTLYAALHHLRRGETSIVTVEDPVERRIDGVNQIHVNTKAGNSFANVLRSVLRQDPNVIMVGEIRDADVAQIVGQAACTGHLVLSSLHTPDAASAVTRLLHLGLEPFKIAESLTAVVAQRLVRRLCPQCRIEQDEMTARHAGREHGLARVPYVAGSGCRHCGQTGYVDRLAVAEVLVPDDATRAAIGKGATTTDLRQAMRASGFRSMRETAIGMVAGGVTSLDEVNRVVAADATPAREEPAPAARQSRGAHVLVTDDDRMIRLLVKLLLEKQGYRVSEAGNGREALQAVASDPPDLLILDLQMPELDGYETLEALASGGVRPVPTIVLTASHAAGVESRVFDLGAEDYLQKPFEPDVLLARIRGVFRRVDRAVA